jgi:hypothetical protein
MCYCLETWKYIIDYPNYKISSKGRFFSKYKKSNMKHSIDKGGYHNIYLYRNGKRNFFIISRLVGIHFIPNPENKPTIDHKNGDKNNNCVCNLEWANEVDQIANRGISKNNTSGYKNIYKHGNMWLFQLNINKKIYTLGYSNCLEIVLDIRDWYYEYILERKCKE